MKSLIISFFGLLFLSLSVFANNTNTENDFIGKWNFSVSQAPWEYSKGNMIFEIKEDNVLSGKMKFLNGVEVKIINVKQKDENLTFDITAEGYVLNIVTKFKENDIDGIVKTPDGDLPFSAKREVPED